MKFELEPYNRNISKDAIREDIRRVADQLHKNAITQVEYRKHGRFSPDVARRRFGSWFKALAEADLSETRNLSIPAEDCIKDLQEVAKHIGNNAVTHAEYKEHGKYSEKPFIRHFGSWLKALESAGLQKTRTYRVTNEEYFENLERMWISLGHQPHYSDVQKPFSQYSARAYEGKFGSWRKALQAFVSYVNKENPEMPSTKQEQKDPKSKLSTESPNKRLNKSSRNISWRLRFLVMRRDGFRCCNCGRSPATEPGVILHIDHNKAWTKDGPTTYDNLRTLCSVCNIGKSNLEPNE